MTCNALAPCMPTIVPGRHNNSYPVTPSMLLTPYAPFDTVRALYAGWVRAGWVKP
jgi:hypothetical protein